MVHSGRHILGMERFRRAEFLFVDLWETSVYYQLSCFAETDILLSQRVREKVYFGTLNS